MGGEGAVSSRKRFYSWEQIHHTCVQSVQRLHEEFNPTLLVPISGGGLIPARMLRSGFKQLFGKTLPMQVVGAFRYDDDAGVVFDKVKRTQWLSPDLQLSGMRCLLIDEVDDSRKTLAFIVADMLRYFGEVEALYHSSETADSPPWVPPQLAVYVIHNKARVKEAEIDSSVYPARYYVGENTPNFWHIYPWDAPEIYSHTATAAAQEHYWRENPDELALAMNASLHDPLKSAATATDHYADGGSTAVPSIMLDGATPSTQPSHDGVKAKAKSALSTALLGQGSSGLPAQDGEVPSPTGMSKVNSGVWRAGPDSMYSNFGHMPNGFEPRFGSLTLVDVGKGVMGAAMTQEQQRKQ